MTQHRCSINAAWASTSWAWSLVAEISTSAWFPVTALIIGHQQCLLWQHGTQISAWLLAATLTTMDTNKAFGGSMDHGNTSRRLSAESEPLFISDILLLLRVRVMVGLGGVFADGTHEGSRLLSTTLPVLQAPTSCLYPVCCPWAVPWPQLSSPAW